MHAPLVSSASAKHGRPGSGRMSEGIVPNGAGARPSQPARLTQKRLSCMLAVLEKCIMSRCLAWVGTVNREQTSAVLRSLFRMFVRLRDARNQFLCVITPDGHET